MIRGSILMAVAAAMVRAPCVPAQSSNPAPPPARDLVVKVLSHFDQEEPPEVGSGIIVGIDAERLYIVTARHVVRRATPAARIYVGLHEAAAGPVLAAASDSGRKEFDVALLTVPRGALPQGWRPPAFDRLGSVGKLRFGDPVSPMGCPQGICWGVPVPADRLVAVDRQGIGFQSVFVAGGSSGGALFNQWWEVVGLVTEDQPPQANAVPMDQVIALVRAWGYPVSLRRAKLSRSGYPIHVGALLLTRLSGSEDGRGAQSRFPSGRLVATRRGDEYGILWHLSGLRLAPRNLAVTAAMGGIGLDFRYGRFAVQPFVEIGAGRVEGRFAADSHFVAGDTAPVIFWQQEKQDGLGAGAGLSLQALVAPHLTLELLAAHWNFRMPDSLTATLPTVFVGTGLRWGF